MTTEMTTQGFNTEFSGLSGGASGFGDPEFVDLLRNESVVAGTGLSVGALQSVARRQLIGSIVVACVIVAVAALAAMRPMHSEALNGSTRSFAAIQQPSFVTPVGQHVAAMKQHVELP